MKLIGLTGGIASGKSLILSMFRREGIPVIDADDLAREVTKPQSEGYATIVERFGDRFVLADGSLDRKSLGRLIFSNDAARTDLENIVHPLISQAMQKRIEQIASSGYAFCVYCAPLIFEKNLQDLFDATILVYCEEQIQVERLMERDGLTANEARLRLSAQMPLSKKRQKTQYQIDNGQTPMHAAKQLSALWHDLTGTVVNFKP